MLVGYSCSQIRKELKLEFIKSAYARDLQLQTYIYFLRKQQQQQQQQKATTTTTT